MAFLRSAFILAVVISAAGTARAAYIQMAGDLEAFLNTANIPDASSEAFIQPNSAERASWRDAVEELISGDFAACANLADPLGYDLVEYSDSIGGHAYYILLEKTSGGEPLRGLGTYVFNPDWCRSLNIQAPHTRNDLNTRPESIDMFLQLDATFLQIAGTHRCANSACTPCSGSSSVCGGCNGSRYFESDSAHFVDNFFQQASNEVAGRIGALVSVNVHGWTPCSPATDTSFVVVSNGTRGIVDVGLATEIATEYNALLAGLYTGEPAGSCNAGAGGPTVVWPCSAVPFCGTTNTQGRALNGSPNACSTTVSDAPLPERFIHLEQQPSLRAPPDSPVIPGISWQITIDVFAALFPCHKVPGDIDHDGDADLTDLDIFVGVLVGSESLPMYVGRSDLNNDGVADGGDIQLFVNALVGG